ncbi:putative ribonuclease H-like domain-containing protein [Tanacetum coccineum]|uniref:Ribonuclease H-like domain-containing protein n=1 Tax=Tanacetum coccineum TaxID=301880 RepID=A0ABQ5CRB9_9ASTR
MAGEDEFHDDNPPPPPPPVTPTQQATHILSTIKLPIMKKVIKFIFGGNDESKKMQKYILKQQFESFSVSNSKGLHKGYGRFQSLLSQLEIHGAGVSTEDANQKFLRSIPASWSQVSLIMRTKPGVDTLSFDDIYNNLRVFDYDIKGSTASSSSTQNVAFVSSESTNTTNDVSTAYGVSISSGYNSQKEGSSSYTDELKYSFFANQSSGPQLDHEDLEQVDEFDLDEMDLKWQVAMISMRLKKFYKKTERRLQFDAKEPVGFDKTKEEPKALVTLDEDGVDWTGHAEDEQENFALMAHSNSGSNTEVTSCSKECEESYANLKKLYNEQREKLGVASIEIQAYTQALKKVEAQLVYHQQNQLIYEEKIKFVKIDLDDKTNVLTYRKKLLAEAVKEKEELKTKLENFQSSSKGLSKLLNSQMSTRDKSGLGYGNQIHEGVLSCEKVVLESVFDSRSSNAEDSPVNDKFAKVEGMHVVPHPMIGIYKPSKFDFGIDESKFTYGPKQSCGKLEGGLNSSCCWGKGETAVQGSADDPQKALKNKGIIDNGCSKHMAGNKAYLVEYQDYNGGPVAFGDVDKRTRDIIEFCGSKGIKREYNNARTPQQNEVVERKNMTLIETARTMLAYSFLPNTFWAEAVSTACYVLNRVLVTKPQNKIHYELITGKIPIISYIRPFGCHVTILNTIDHLGKFEEKSDEEFLVGYSLDSKAFRVYNLETKRVEENLHINYLENKPNFAGIGPNWLFDLDYLIDSMNYQPVTAENKANKTTGPKEGNHSASTQDNIDAGNSEMETEPAQEYFVLPVWSSYTSIIKSSEAKNGDVKPNGDTGPKTNEEPKDQKDQAFLEELERLKRQEKEANDATKVFSADITNTVNTISTPSSSASPSNDIYDNPRDGIFTNASYDDEGAMADFTNLESIVIVSLFHFKVTTPFILLLKFLEIQPQQFRQGAKYIKIEPKKISQALEDKSWVDAMQKELINKARLFVQGYRQEEGIDYDEVFALVARIEATRIFLAFASYMGFIVYQMDVNSAFLYGTIDMEVYMSQPPGFVDPKFPKKVYKVVKALYGLHQAPRAWYAILSTFLLKNRHRRGTIEKTLFIKKDKNDIMLVQVYVDDIIFGSTKSQDKYVAEILKKFDFASVKTASTLIETQKPLTKDEEAADVDVHLYRSMIGSLIYFTTFRPDIMFAVCACSRFQVTPKTFHLHDVKRIFRYLKGKPKLGLWYPRVSSFDLESYSDSDYAGANLDRKSTTGGCQFLGRRLISWQCKKQTIVTTSTIEVEYVAAANCCGQVLWILNQMLDYGFNFMNTKIYIDNESTICIVKNPVFHSKTKHIEIRHHFIRDAYEKKLIQVLNIHVDDNVADLLTKAFDTCSTQAAEIKDLKAQIKQLKKKTRPVINHHKAWFRAARLKKQQKKKDMEKSKKRRSVSKQGRKAVKSSKGAPSVQTHTDWDGLDTDLEASLNEAMDTLAQDEGKTDSRVEEPKTSSKTDELHLSGDTFVNKPKNKKEDKGSAEKGGSTKGTDLQQSTVKPDESTVMPDEGTDKQDESTDSFVEGTAEIKDQVSGESDTSTTPTMTSTPTITVFGDDVTIAQVLVTMSQNKIFPKVKGKGMIEEEDESDTELEDITEAEKKFKMLVNDEEMAKKVQEEWEAKEEKKRLAEEEATKAAFTNEYDFIQARLNADKILAEKLQEEEREKFTIEERAKLLHDTIASQKEILCS